MDRTLTQLVEKLQKTFSERLVSVILYGSAAVGDHHEGYSDFNVLCVLADITPRELGESEPIVRWWRDHGNPAPLLLSAAEVRASTDCFPIEFHDMKERRKVLTGADVIEGLEIDDSFYRAQVEHEMRAKLIRLRQKAAGVLSDKVLLLRLLADSVSTFAVLFRHALRLAGSAEAPWVKREAVALAASRFGFDASPFVELLDVREQKRKPREVEPETLFAEYLKQIQVVLDAVDQLEK